MKKDEILALAGECGFKLDWAISNCTGQFESFYHAAIESYKAELLKGVGEPTCRVSTTGIITNQTNAPLEPGLELYTADQLIAARKGLEEEIERLSERRCEICGYAEHHREHASCLRTQLAAAREEIANETAEAIAKFVAFQRNDIPATGIEFAEVIRSGEYRKFMKEV